MKSLKVGIVVSGIACPWCASGYARLISAAQESDSLVSMLHGIADGHADV